MTSLTGTSIVADTDLGPITGVSGVDDLAPGDEVVAVWRPERTMLTDDEPTGANAWQGSIEAALFLGSHTEHVVHVGDARFLVWSPDAHKRQENAPVWLSVQPAHVRVLPAAAQA